MVYLDLFSGYGGFHLALENAGFEFEQVHFSEIDKHAIANYTYNFPKAIYAGPIQSVGRTFIPKADIITFGWPCQDNSIAGKRKGQSEGTRSGLLYEAVRCISEHQPGHFIAENVPGLTSVNEGVDYIEAIKILSFLNESCPQYDVEMQLCNTRWLLPQNRERLFFVGHLRGKGSRQVFPIGEDGKIDSKFIKVIGNTNPCGHGMNGNVFSSDGLAPTLSTNKGEGIKIVANTAKGYEEVREGDSINFSVPNSKTRRGRVGKGIAQTLDTTCNQGIITHYGHKDKEPTYHDISPTLKAQSHGHEPMTNIGQRIRRLTPIECERLQGLPDNHTKYGIYDGVIKEISDSQRYKLCGNGVSIPIVEMIAKKLFNLNYKK